MIISLVTRFNALLVGVVLCSGLSAQPAKPNVLIFYADDMGWAQPGACGGKLAPTPALDAIAKNGVRFTDGYVAFNAVHTPHGRRASESRMARRIQQRDRRRRSHWILRQAAE